MSVKSFRLQGIHMAKSKLVGQKLISAGDDFTLEFPTLHYSFLINNIDVTVDLTRLMHFRCDVAQNKASRQQQIVKYARAFKKEMSLGATSSTLYNSFTKFKGYLIWCDDKEIFPFVFVLLIGTSKLCSSISILILVGKSSLKSGIANWKK